MNVGSSTKPLKAVTGSVKASVLLMTVGADSAAEVLRRLNEEDMQLLSDAMSQMQALDRQIALGVLREFKDMTSGRTHVLFDSDGIVREMLNRLGLDHVPYTERDPYASLAALEAVPALDLYEAISNEHPQVVATLLTRLDPPKASALLVLFPEAERNEIMVRLAQLKHVDPAALEDLNVAIEHALLNGKKRAGGVQPAADILGMMPNKLDQKVIEGIRHVDSDLAESILERMFVFEDFLDVPDQSLQILLMDVPQQMLAMALKGASPKLRDKMLTNMTRIAATRVQDELDMMPPVKVADVESQQREIIRIARMLADDGKIDLALSDQLNTEI